MLNLGIQPEPITVEIKQFDMGMGLFDFEFEAGAIPTSLALKLGGDDLSFSLLDFLTLEDVADRIYGWKSDALKDKDSGVMLPCTRENVLQFMDEIPKGYTLLTSALTKAYYLLLAKNSKGLSDTTGTKGASSAKPAKSSKKRRTR